MSHRGEGGQKSDKKKCHVLFEWPLSKKLCLKLAFFKQIYHYIDLQTFNRNLKWVENIKNDVKYNTGEKDKKLEKVEKHYRNSGADQYLNQFEII